MISVYAARFSAVGLRAVSGTYPIVTVSELVEKEEEEWLGTKISVGQRKAAGPFAGH